MKKNLKGNGSIKGLLVLVIVCIVGFFGWYVLLKKPAARTSTPANTSSNILQSQNSSDAAQTKTLVTSSKGFIKGNLGYPSSGNPAQSVCAVNIADNKDVTCISTSVGQNTYSIEMKPGEYYVYASLMKQMGDVTPEYKAYYDEFSRCGNSVSCPASAHKEYIKVTITANGVVDNINPTDWYFR